MRYTTIFTCTCPSCKATRKIPQEEASRPMGLLCPKCELTQRINSMVGVEIDTGPKLRKR